MNIASAWRSLVRSTEWMGLFRHGFTAVVSAPMLLVTLYVGLMPLPPLTAVRGTIESAQVAPCMDWGRKTFFSARGCIDGTAIRYRDQNGLAQTVVFRMKGDPPFNAALFPRGAVLDVLVQSVDLGTTLNQYADAVAVNGAVLKPLKDERLFTRLGYLALAVACTFVVATFIGRLQLRAQEKACEKARAKAMAGN
ncbi:MAG: hypothetical protein SGJ23_06075 [Alphaproteobacteria bacterium]|nr:hypothetical protein [Alphaproteobacteria bacterium]